jgi:hypothetical protein
MTTADWFIVTAGLWAAAAAIDGRRLETPKPPFPKIVKRRRGRHAQRTTPEQGV